MAMDVSMETLLVNTHTFLVQPLLYSPQKLKYIFNHKTFKCNAIELKVITGLLGGGVGSGLAENISNSPSETGRIVKDVALCLDLFRSPQVAEVTFWVKVFEMGLN